MSQVESFSSVSRLFQTLQMGLITLFCGMIPNACVNQMDHVSTLRQYDAFAYMQVETNIIVAYGCLDAENKNSCTFITTQPHKSNASGVVVMNSKTRQGRQYVMTAAHVCESAVNNESNLRAALLRQSSFIVDRFMYSSTILIKNSSGREFPGKVVVLMPQQDLCIVAVEGMKIIPVNVAHTQVKQGEKIWNLAAPLGIWQPGLQNKFEGYYAGHYVCDEETRETFPIKCELGIPAWSVFDLPATHGSSGSPIFNSRGELIGIVSMVPSSFPEIAYASRLEDIRRIIEITKEWDKLNEEIDFDTDSETINHPKLLEL